MSKYRLTSYTARKSTRGGFTLVELLVVIGIIAILAGVALGPITQGLEKAKESAGMQTARTLGLSAFQYSVDVGTYPGGSNSEDVCIALVQGQYIQDASIFAASGAQAYKGTDIKAIGASNIAWDFMAGAAPTPPATGSVGLTTSDPDGMPAIFSTGQNVPVPAQGAAAPAIELTNKNPFGNHGMAVCYKSNSAVFIKAQVSGTTATVPGSVTAAGSPGMFSPSFYVSPGATYTQLKP